MDNLNSISPSVLIAALSAKVKSPEEVFPGHKIALFNSGRQALLALFKKKHWKKIGLPTFTCPIIYHAVVDAGAEPVFVDIDLETYNLSLFDLKKTSRLDALVVVHTFGAHADIAKIRQMLGKKTAIVEDRAHAFNLPILAGAKDQGDYLLISLYKQFNNFGGSALLSKKELFSTRPATPLPDLASLASLLLVSENVRPILNLYRKYQPLPQAPYTSSKHIDSRFKQLYWNLFAVQLPGFPKKVKTEKSLHWRLSKLLAKDLFNLQKTDPNQSNFFMLNAQLKFGNSNHRDALLSRLRKKGIFLDRIWYNTQDPKNSHGQNLADHIINIPLTENSQQKIVKTIDTINRLARELKNEDDGCEDCDN